MTDIRPGFLNIDKPAGWTSFQAVAAVRRILGIRKAGHGGTLDPMATGVLPVALGPATRLTDRLHDQPKVYRARIRLGIATETDDAEGAITSERPVDVTRSDVEMVLATMVGDVLQVPPAFSALKREGLPAYARARRGETVVLEPRPVSIASIDVLAMEGPDVTVRVRCGRGTYLRSIARDLGQVLGCGGHLAGLVREAVGALRVEEAVPPSVLEQGDRDELERSVLTIAETFPDLPVVLLTEPGVTQLRNGQRAAGRAPVPVDGPMALAIGPDGTEAGMVSPAPGGWWQPEIVFPAAGRARQSSQAARADSGNSALA